MSSFSSIDAMISKVKERFGAEHKISVMFENCISNTLNTNITIFYIHVQQKFIANCHRKTEKRCACSCTWLHIPMGSVAYIS